jgi:hypothetical protein
MKHLRKYNESVVEEFDIDYISNCFIDLIDKGAKVNIGNPEEYICSIDIELPKPSCAGEMVTVKEFIEYNNKLQEIYKEIDYSLEKVNLKLDYNNHVEQAGTSRLMNTSYEDVFEYFDGLYVVFTKKEEEK